MFRPHLHFHYHRSLDEYEWHFFSFEILFTFPCTTWNKCMYSRSLWWKFPLKLGKVSEWSWTFFYSFQVWNKFSPRKQSFVHFFLTLESGKTHSQRLFWLFKCENPTWIICAFFILCSHEKKFLKFITLGNISCWKRSKERPKVTIVWKICFLNYIISFR